LKPNIIGIVGGILAFVSLALPWWTMSVSSLGISMDVSVYPYMAGMSGIGLSTEISLWYGWVALALIIVGGLLGIVGSLKPDKAKMLSVGGALALVSIIIFAVGLQLDFLNIPSTEGAPAFALFGGNTISVSGYDISYFAYLSFGFWIALVAAIVMFIASRKKPAAAVAAPPPPPPPVTY
jgi:putative Mn2+ efflux pump MntP